MNIALDIILPVIPFRFISRCFGLGAALSLCLTYSASSVARETVSAPPPDFARFSVAENHPIVTAEPGTERRNIRVVRSVSGELLMVYRKFKDGTDEGLYLRRSMDGGASFSGEESVSVPETDSGSTGEGTLVPLQSGLGYSILQGGNILFQKRGGTGPGWSQAAQINDELRTAASPVSFAQGADGGIFCAWVDMRRGFPLVYFSASSDGGETWSANRPVDYDFREGDQRSPKLVMGASGRVLVFWEDWRDRNTLVDIRYAYSDDGGGHWISGGRVNDDDQHVWQVDFGVVSLGHRIYIAFSDFRDPGKEGDNDWNIYFARSDDNGKTFGRNLRVNDIAEGIDKFPRLAVNGKGEVFCAWRSGRNSIFGEIAVSYSPDGGDHWSPSAVLPDGDEYREIAMGAVMSLDNSDLLIGWRSDGFEGTEHRSEIVSFGDGTPLKTGVARKRDRPLPMKVTEGGEVFRDTFSQDGPKWDEEEGVWLKVEGAYMGVGAGNPSVFTSFAPVSEPDSYVLKGRFRLDPVAHFLANIYFRTDSSSTDYFVINNQFRTGSWLTRKSGGPPLVSAQRAGNVIDQERFAFQNNRWYSFRLVVTPGKIDYFVDGRHMLSSRGFEDLPPGRIGFGGLTTAPAYFDDISVHRIEQ